jgi:hypothetical protein
MRGGLKDMILEIVLAYNILLRLTFPRLNSGNKTGSKVVGLIGRLPMYRSRQDLFAPSNSRRKRKKST